MLPEPVLLTDYTRLPELFRLRTLAWENSDKVEYVNQNLFPEGWSDALDANGQHLVVADDNGDFIAAARFNLFDSLAQFPHHAALRHLSLPPADPFSFFSRLVVHPAHRSQGWSSRLDISRLLHCQLNSPVRWILVLATNERMGGLVEKLRFRVVGEALVNYHVATLPHPVNVFIKELF